MTENRARTVFLLAHTGRPAAVRSAELVVKGLLRSGLLSCLAFPRSLYTGSPVCTRRIQRDLELEESRIGG